MAGQLVGASVLPVMLDPLYGTLYFLLAKERYHTSWPDGSCLWSDFGGRQESGEDAVDVAAREFMEESLGTVQFLEEHKTSSQESIAQALKNEHYVLQFTHLHNGHRFVTFVVHIPWDPSVCSRFSAARALLLHSCESVDLHFLEKSHLGLFSAPQLLDAIKHRGSFLASRNHERCSTHLTDALSVILPELQFHFPHLF